MLKNGHHRKISVGSSICGEGVKAEAENLAELDEIIDPTTTVSGALRLE